MTVPIHRWTAPLQLSRLVAVAIVALLIVACGAGGDSRTAGIDRGGIGSGPVSGFGSIWLNGSRYETSGADVFVNGQLATESELRIGQVVLIRAIYGSGDPVGQTVVYESSLQGPVSAVDIAGNNITVLGQQVLINAVTSFGSGIDPADISGLKVDDIVEVSGLVDDQERIVATRIDLQGAPYEIQLNGVVSDLVSGVSFKVGDQLVDYSSATTIDGFSGGAPENGDRVRVTGDGFGSLSEIIAETVSFRGLPGVADGDEGEVEGLITDFIGPQNFRLAGIPVTATAQTVYEGGSSANLADNVRIEAEGEFDNTGTLIADKIEFEDEGDSFLEAIVDPAGVSGDTVSVFGITVLVTGQTALEDKSDADERFFSIGDIIAGDTLRVEGSWNGSELVALKLERVNPEDKIKIKAAVSAAALPVFTMLGKQITTDAVLTDYQDDQPAFFSDLALCVPGCEVEARWLTADAPWTIVKEVELD